MPQSLCGRSTRTGVVCNLEATKKSFLKDTWRVAIDGFETEGAIYHLLHRRAVPHIAGVERSGDVQTAQGTQTQTRTQEYKSRSSSGDHMHGHVHYRLILDVVGEEITQFQSTCTFVKAVIDVLEAHRAAYIRCHILHRDVSVNNMLLLPSGEAILIDWDTSWNLKKDVKQRREARTASLSHQLG
ncbi:hypothetical protein CONPUDRAFT_127912 [Coniophora puteana RWD-64-598 SS2]|uniref:Fungal-type protein kinase domain-containing protein n=1 Tax=Coniophora puteana (strain RWD-64-598) TaxID=741705 RepID=A0A5M3MHS8_CONPW|nr:uncharacterized protein CONPUDRAFT_127912 [Coniophora puteana RWD-64-598 SS2]EIW78344.1 hypothetical protein CONPUDRAFT_127912 [Coniophora puteana RWD-64-598 SS2]